jgi:DNA repair exonuclease SbcCD ATPase subunit
MATASNQFDDKKCYTCQPKKVAAITSCCGCHRHFCCKHFIEHRDQLSKNLNNIVNQHDEILQDLKSKTNHSSKNQLDSNDVQNLFRQIDDWEIETINACHLAANKARDSIKQLLNTADENDSLIERLSSIAKELEEQQQSVNFVEHDLERWIEQLEELKIDVNRSIEFPNNIIIITQAIDWEESIKISQLSISDKMTKHYVLVVGEKGVGL